MRQIAQTEQNEFMNEVEDSRIFIKGFVIGMPTNCLVLEYFWLFEPLKENPFEYYFSIYFMLFCCFMVFISYYQCMNIKNYVPSRMPPNNDNLINADGKNNKICDVCKAWRPPRARHCINCNVCTLKYDHHCPWIFNCVGLRNHKAFFLFCFYLMLGALQYCYRTILFAIYLTNLKSREHIAIYFYFYWIFTSFILFPLTLMFVGLSVFHFMLAIKNYTSEEPFEEDFLKIPCFSSSLDPDKMNIYDQGFLSNFTKFIGNSYFLFWFPTKTSYENDGTISSINPQENAKDIQQNLGIDEKYYKPDQLSTGKRNFDEYIKNTEETFKNFNLKINDKVYEFWKKKELES